MRCWRRFGMTAARADGACRAAAEQGRGPALENARKKAISEPRKNLHKSSNGPLLLSAEYGIIQAEKNKAAEGPPRTTERKKR